MKQTIFITGTPTVGKTTISEKLALKLNAKLIKINDFVFENNLTLGKDENKGYEVIDIDKLDIALTEEIKKHDGIIIVEGHVSHLCNNADKIIVLRANPDILKKRLIDRNYSQSKIRENLEAEALDVCGVESFNIYKNKVCEIDIGYLDIDESVDILERVINENMDCSFGNIDFVDWLIENPN